MSNLNSKTIHEEFIKLMNKEKDSKESTGFASVDIMTAATKAVSALIQKEAYKVTNEGLSLYSQEEEDLESEDTEKIAKKEDTTSKNEKEDTSVIEAKSKEQVTTEDLEPEEKEVVEKSKPSKAKEKIEKLEESSIQDEDKLDSKSSNQVKFEEFDSKVALEKVEEKEENQQSTNDEVVKEENQNIKSVIEENEPNDNKAEEELKAQVDDPNIDASPISNDEAETEEIKQMVSDDELKKAEEGISDKYEEKEDTVFSTVTGKRYHKAHCRYNRKNAVEMTIKEAEEKGKSACPTCFI